MLVVKNPSANAGNIRDTDSVLGSEDPLEEGMAIHSSIFAWRIPWTEEPHKQWSIGSQRVGHDWSVLALFNKANKQYKYQFPETLLISL